MIEDEQKIMLNRSETIIYSTIGILAIGGALAFFFWFTDVLTNISYWW